MTAKPYTPEELATMRTTQDRLAALNDIPATVQDKTVSRFLATISALEAELATKTGLVSSLQGDITNLAAGLARLRSPAVPAVNPEAEKLVDDFVHRNMPEAKTTYRLAWGPSLVPAVPADVAGLVERLYEREPKTRQVDPIAALEMNRAATALESLAAENARLQTERAEERRVTIEHFEAADKLEAQARELAAKDESNGGLREKIRTLEAAELAVCAELDEANASLRLEVAKRAALMHAAEVEERYAARRLSESKADFRAYDEGAVKGIEYVMKRLRDSLDPAARDLLDRLDKAEKRATELEAITGDGGR